MDKKLSQNQIKTLLKKYEVPKKDAAYSVKKLRREDYEKLTDRNYKDGDRN